MRLFNKNFEEFKLNLNFCLLQIKVVNLVNLQILFAKLFQTRIHNDNCTQNCNNC